MENINEKCIICRLDSAENPIIVSKGLATIIEASKKRNDGLDRNLENESIVYVHPSCRRQYTRPSSIRAASVSQVCENVYSSLPLLRKSTESVFSFKTHCLFCGKDASENLKTPIKYRQDVHLVETLEFNNTILQMCNKRDDTWAIEIKTRILDVFDLVAAEGRYHGKCHKAFLKPKTDNVSSGRPKDETAKSQFQELCLYLEQNDECQYSLQEIRKIIYENSGSDISYSDRHLQSELKSYFGDRLVVSSVSGKKSIFCMSHASKKILHDNYSNPNNMSRQSIVEYAAQIIREDIQKMVYDCDKYPSVSEIKCGGNNLIPETLSLFTSVVTKKRIGDQEPDVIRKRAFINFSIISLVRPRTFISPIHTPLALYLNRYFGSKHLLEILSSVGACSSYYEAELYQRSLITAGPPNIADNAFEQYVFDNADVNVRTIDGLNTFHGMGGIKCLTPKSKVDCTVDVPRISRHSFCVPDGIRKLHYVNKNGKFGLKKLLIEDLTCDIKSIRNNKKIVCYISPLNFLWISGINTLPGWNEFMTVVNNNETNYDTSYILAVPFIDMEASNPSSIYTALSFAAEECRKNNSTCIVTFDQPLFLKASEIVFGAEESSNLSKIILRLGGFHLLMSFMGSVGRIMEGSGIESLWESVYAQTTVNHMITGHAYARALRAYMLTAAALVQVLVEEYPNVSLDKLKEIHSAIINKDMVVNEVLADTSFTSELSKFTQTVEEAKLGSRTAKLWLNLLEQVDLMLCFIYAERTGDWNLHLSTTIEMLPYFHSAGHLPYAKSAHLYVQQMRNLNNTLTETEFELFTKQGYFTIRRKESFYSGVWTDMCIEQSLMKSMKTTGGLTRGRGITDSTLSKWVLGAPSFLQIQDALQNFTGTSYETTEQHVELRESRKRRDLTDYNKFVDWLRQHNPFTKYSGELVSLSSGQVSDDTVTCDDSYDIGLTAMKNMVGQNFADLKLRRKDMVKSQAAKESIKIRSQDVTVNSQQIFNRIMCTYNSTSELKSCFEYELSSSPPSLFEGTMMRKGNKASLLKSFSCGIIERLISKEDKIILDGGYLLHAVVWPKRCTYETILNTYVCYVINKYGKNVQIIFDGYPNTPTTKQQEQSRRSVGKTSSNIVVTEHTNCVTPQEAFLGNTRNKKQLISLLVEKFNSNNIFARVAAEDADTEIVNAAYEMSKNRNQNITVVGTDTDLIVLLIALAPTDICQLYFLKPSSKEDTMYSIDILVKTFIEIQKELLFIHGITGCDTTSALYGLGKVKALNIINTSPDSKSQATAFIEVNATREQLFLSGEQFILSLYGLSQFENLNEARYFYFKRLTAKLSLKSTFSICKLPPTTDACRQHLLRVYYQIQSWLGNKMQPTDWGWRIENGLLKPIAMIARAGPDSLLETISCNCKADCVKSCGCRRSNLHCSSLCGNCNGLSCSNTYKSSDSYSDTEDDVEEI